MDNFDRNQGWPQRMLHKLMYNLGNCNRVKYLICQSDIIFTLFDHLLWSGALLQVTLKWNKIQTQLKKNISQIHSYIMFCYQWKWIFVSDPWDCWSRRSLPRDRCVWIKWRLLECKWNVTLVPADCFILFSLVVRCQTTLQDSFRWRWMSVVPTQTFTSPIHIHVLPFSPSSSLLGNTIMLQGRVLVTFN